MENKEIKSPKIGAVVRHTGWRFEDDENYPCDVYIESGRFLSNGRISNWWTWRIVQEDGSLSNKISGYGSFVASENRYEIATRANCMENALDFINKKYENVSWLNYPPSKDTVASWLEEYRGFSDHHPKKEQGEKRLT